MATAYKILGQISPTPSTATTLYTVPAATSTVVSSITICNYIVGTGIQAPLSIQLWVRVGGAAASVSNLLLNNVTVLTGETLVLKLGLTLAAGCVLTVQTSATPSTCTIMAFGSEIS